jgi:hypothetical protein
LFASSLLFFNLSAPLQSDVNLVFGTAKIKLDDADARASFDKLQKAVALLLDSNAYKDFSVPRSDTTKTGWALPFVASALGLL